MKNYLKLGLAGLMLANNAVFSYAPAEGWYVGLTGVGSYVPDLDFTVPHATVNQMNNRLISNGFLPLVSHPVGKIDYSFGGGGALQLGYRYCGFRFEGELLLNYNPYNEILIGGIPFKKKQYILNPSGPAPILFPFSMSGHSQLGAGIFNVYYDFYNLQSDDITWIPYAGLGIGYASVRNQFTINYNFINPTTGLNNFTSVFRLRSNTSSPIGQAILGVSYVLDDTFSVGLDYRYMSTKELSNFNERLTMHTVNLNFNYWFNA
ncbi:MULTISPECIES: outer membrane protein [unclassified Legionella]|uniref:outer membrane protein n=1 Tax=unclassified Legionella TaxID=2622702 RepID=UPI001054EBAA|nr:MULTISPECIES: outer membrane beta-barrel protein [unclassified Legionella]MDI9817724.1 outer membrane beta-barrel protein [Legionella sp. PL877]